MSYGVILTELLLKCIFAGKDYIDMIYKISNFIGELNLFRYKASNRYKKYRYDLNKSYYLDSYLSNYLLSNKDYLALINTSWYINL